MSPECSHEVHVGLGTSVKCELGEGHVGEHVTYDGVYRWDGKVLKVVIEAAWTFHRNRGES